MNLTRADGVLDLDMVKATTLFVLGTGSVGSKIAGLLAYDWQQLVLVDPEVFDAGKVERHLLGKDAVGGSKAVGVRSHLIEVRGVDPRSVTAFVGTAQDYLAQTMLTPSLVIVNIDHRQSKRDVNAWCRQHDIPALYTGVYPLGTATEIIVVPRPTDICYRCAEHMMGGDKEVPHAHHDYGIDLATFVDSAGEAHAVPALSWTVDSVASDTVELALAYLSGEPLESQVQIHAHSWETIINLVPGGEEIKAWSQYIANHTLFGMLPNVRIHYADGKPVLQARRGIYSLTSIQWSGCPLHSTAVSLEDI